MPLLVSSSRNIIDGSIPSRLTDLWVTIGQALHISSSNATRGALHLRIESPFEKVGRLYLVGVDMVIRSDLDSRGFRIPLDDIDVVINGEPQSVRLLTTGKKVGTAQLSTSGRAMNFSISPFLYTTPLQSLMRMLAGEQRKAPLFVGREQVEG